MIASAQFYTSGTFWTAVTAIGSLLLVLVTILFLKQPKRLLLYTISEATSVVTSRATGDRVGTKLQVIYGSDTLDDPYITSLHIQIRGRRDIRAADFEQDEPLKFDFGARIVALLPMSEPLPLAEKGLRAAGTKILIGPTLIRKRATVRIDTLTDGKPDVRCHSPLADVKDRKVSTLSRRESWLPWWADVILRGSRSLSLTWATSLFILLLVTLAVLGHSIWHSEMLAVFNSLTTLFTGVPVVNA
jgi:hypothetical protein